MIVRNLSCPIVLAILAAGTAHAAAKAKPSFDCARVQMTEITRAICDDPATAALDRRIAKRFEKLRRGLPVRASAALDDDQQYFEYLRLHVFRASDGNAASLQAMMAQRAAFLDAVVLDGPQRHAGTWRNFAGTVTVTDNGSVMIVESYNDRICRVTGRLEGSVLAGKVTLHGQPGRSIELSQLQTVMVVTDSAGDDENACGLGDDPFFRVAAQP